MQFSNSWGKLYLGTNKYPKLLLFKLRAHHLETMWKETGIVIQQQGDHYKYTY